MPIYKYTIKKYVKSYSTWIIAFVTFLLILFGMGVLPFQIYPPKKTDEYTKRVLILIPVITVFLSIFSSVFSGFKSANMVKDEIEDGTFLIMISKPITRQKILIYKWLALQTFLIFYALYTAALEAMIIAIFDNGEQFTQDVEFLGLRSLKDEAFVIFGFTAIILYIMSLTFSSITILLSTRLSVGSTIGIAIALGVVIPITRLVSVFTKKNEIYNVIDKSIFASLNPFEKLNDEKLQQYSKFKNFIDPNNKTIPDAIHNLVRNLDLKKTQAEYKKTIHKLANDPQSIYEVGYLSGEKNAYRNLWFLDTNFQISQLSSLVYDEIIPQSIQNRDSLGTLNPAIYYEVTNKGMLQAEGSELILDKLNNFIASSWAKTKDVRANLLSLWVALLFLVRNDIAKIASSNWLFNDIYSSYQEIMQSLGSKVKPLLGLDQFGSPANYDFFLELLNTIEIIRESTTSQTSMSNVNKVINLLSFCYSFSRASLNQRYIKIEDEKTRHLFYWLSPLIAQLLLPIETFKHHSIRSIKKERSISSEYKLSELGTAMGLNIETTNNSSKVVFKNDLGTPRTYDFTRLYSYALLEKYFSSYRYGYLAMFQLLKDKATFGRYQRQEYVSKYTILIIFVSISVALIPLSFLSIRRRDFR